jgi:hypothetical protein
MKKTIILIALCLTTAFLAADAFTPDFTLTGVVNLKYITADFYKMPRGYNFTSMRQTMPMPYKPTQKVSFDFDAKRVKIEILMLNRHPLIEPIYIDMDTYQQLALYQTFKDKLYENVRDELDKTDRQTGQGLIPEIVIDLPKSAIPKSVRRIIGEKAGRLNLDGSQKITIGGTSSHRSNSQDEGDQNQNFDIDFRQDLNLRLNGTIGEKVHVNVTHQSSSEDTFVQNPSTIQINYQGTEDEVVKLIEGGNLSLSLTGSKFISYSVSSEGMFGIKAEMEVGDLKMTTIFGRDEAKKDTKKYKGSAEADSTSRYSKEYVKRTHYYIDNPYEMYAIYSEADVTAEGLPASYANNAIKVGTNGGWVVKNAYMLPDREKDFILYVDDGVASNNNLSFEGIEIGHPETTYHFDTRVIGTDYVVDWDNGIVILNETIDKRATIGVIYTRLDGVTVGDDATKQVKLLRKGNQEFETDPEYWRLQVRNIYSLGMQDVDREGFLLNVFDENQDRTKNYNVPDSVAAGMTFNEYLRLDTNADGKINDDDATVDLASGYVYFSFLEPFNALGDPEIYTKDIDYITYEDYHMIIGVKGKIGRETINLGMNILPGSVVVKIGSSKRKLTENVDYIVDYDFGMVTLLSADAKDPNMAIEIDYQYKPIFAVDSKTLVGTRADWEITDNLSLGGTFIYQSETVKEDRPKLGSENRSIILADLDGELEYETPFITRAVDFLPFIRTDEDSNVRLTGEVAMSVPNIYGDKDQDDINEAYIDDMEATLDAFNLGTTRSLWMPASKPYTSNYTKADINWFNPQNIYYRDVFDPESLTEEEEREKVQVLACKISEPEVGFPGVSDRYWSGVMKYVGDNLDFTDKKYIEILAKVEEINGVTPEVVLHVNLGKVSEDFYRPGENDEPDTEDIVNPDGKLDYDEDTGLDGIATGKDGDDPDDDYSNKKETVGNEEEYPEINGMEGNDRLDTEDLDDNGTLNLAEVYLDYVVSLNDAQYLESQYNGWRLYRIPLNDQSAYNVVTDNPSLKPTLEKVNYARVWFETEQTTRVKLVTLDIVGNKWEDDFIKDDNGNIFANDNEVVQAGIADNQKDPHYTSAPGTVIKKDGEVTLEQSLAVDFSNIEESHNATVTQNFKQDPLNLLSYSKIRFWVYPEKSKTDISSGTFDQTLIIRLGADSLTYYEVRTPITFYDYGTKMDKKNWREVQIDFSALTQLKIDSDSLNIIQKDGMRSYTAGDVTYSMVYQQIKPVLTNIKEITLGVHADTDFTGRIYFDDIRVADPYEDMGYASNVAFHSTLADFATLDLNYEWKTANFQNSGNRDTNLSDNQETTRFSASSQIKLNKFLPTEWGLSVPVNLNYQKQEGTPLYQANSDILRDDLSVEEKKRQKSFSETRHADVSFSQNRMPKSKILEYLIKNATVSGSVEKRETTSATNTDTTLTYSMKHVYKLSLTKDDISLPIWGDYKFYFFPNTFNNTVHFNASDPKRWRWETSADSSKWVPVAQTANTRTLNTDSYVKYDIFSDVESSYKLITKRDLTRKNYYEDVNIGEEKERKQDITLDYNPSYLADIFSYNVDTSVKYSEQHLQSGTADTLHYKGNVKRSISGRMTLKNKDLLQNLARKLEQKYGSTVAEQQEEQLQGKEPQGPKGETTEPDELTKLQNRDDLSKEEMEKLRSLQRTGAISDPAFGRTRPGVEPDPARTGELLDPQKNEEEQKKPVDVTKLQEPALLDTTAVADSTAASGEEEPREPAKPLYVTLVNYLSRLDNITVNYSNNYSTNYDDLGDRPSFLYQIGAPHELDPDFISLKTNVDKYSASTGLLLMRNLSTSWNYSLEVNKKYGNVSQMTVTTVFPSVSVTLNEVEKMIHAEKVLTSSRLSGSYSVTRIEEGDIDFKDPKSEQLRLNLSPLLSWNGNWANNITTTVSTSYMDNERITNNTSGNITVKNTTWSASTNVSYTFTAEKGIKMPFTTRKIKFNNELTADLGLSYEDSYSTTDNSADDKKATVDVDKVRFTISPSANYKFSKNITGGLTCSYDKTIDDKRGDTLSTFQLSFFVEVLF